MQIEGYFDPGLKEARLRNLIIGPAKIEQIRQMSRGRCCIPLALMDIRIND